MTSFRLTVLSAALFCSACTTPDSPQPDDGLAASLEAGTRENALMGTWKFDAAASTVFTVTMQANNGTLGKADEETKRLTSVMEGSTATFSADTLTVGVPDGRKAVSSYRIVSQDDNGNYTIADGQGRTSKYSVSGNKLINPAPELNYVSVYVRQ